MSATEMQAGADRMVRSWASLLEDQTIEQAKRTARSRAVSGPVALMPDAHVGIGATVGSVIPTRSAIIPAAVGVDIGCGMIAAQLTLSAGDLPDDLEPVLSQWHRDIPSGVGRTATKGGRRAGQWMADNPMPEPARVRRPTKAADQLGTLGGGNHFAELCLDETETVWVVVHSGSRGVGNELAQGHIKSARKLRFEEALEDPDLAYFTQGTP